MSELTQDAARNLINALSPACKLTECQGKPRCRTCLAMERASPVAKARPLEWDQDYDTQWTDKHHGFAILEEQGEELPFSASWGESDTEQFATLQEAKAWCQAEIDCWVARHAVLPNDNQAPLLRQALDALEHHREQTRPIQRTDVCIEALRRALGVRA